MNLDELINSNYKSLNFNDMHIWKCISKNKRDYSNLTIEELAIKCNVSKTTILRFIQKLSLRGYEELKLYLNYEDNEIECDLDENNKLICNVLDYNIGGIKEKDFKSACKMIYKAKKVFIYGTSNIPKYVVKEMNRMFILYYKNVSILEPFYKSNISLNNISDDDLVILISLSGESEEIIKLAKELNKNKIKILSITKYSNNRLAKLSNEHLYTTECISINKSFEYETTSEFFVLAEVLFVKYRNYNKNVFKEYDYKEVKLV